MEVNLYKFFLSFIYIFVAVGDPIIKREGLGFNYQEGRVGIQSSRGKGWDSIMRREVLGFNHQEGRVGIQSSRRKGWDSIIKREGLGCNYQEEGLGFNHQDGRVGIQFSRGKGWDSIIKREGLGFNHQEGGWDSINSFNPATFLCLSQAMTWISNIICRHLFYVQ
jgi:hypothetical protein